MLDVDPKHLLEVVSADDQQPVQALGADGADPALRMRVRSGCPYRREEHLATLRPEDLIEAAGELRVSIAEQEPHPTPWFAEHQQQVAGLLGDPGAVGVGGHPAKWTRRVSSSMKNST
jgi:hypothetical protein